MNVSMRHLIQVSRQRQKARERERERQRERGGEASAETRVSYKLAAQVAVGGEIVRSRDRSIDENSSSRLPILSSSALCLPLLDSDGNDKKDRIRTRRERGRAFKPRRLIAGSVGCEDERRSVSAGSTESAMSETMWLSRGKETARAQREELRAIETRRPSYFYCRLSFAACSLAVAPLSLSHISPYHALTTRARARARMLI